jgi:hypothetical protein
MNELNQKADPEELNMDLAVVTLMFASFPSSAPSAQSIVVTHGWFLQ